MRFSSSMMCAVVVCLAGMAVTCQAGVALEMVPDNPGPYFGGETLTVDMWLNSGVDYDVLLKMIRFDFTQTDPGISLASVLAFDYSALPGLNFYWTYPELPVPWTIMPLDCICPGFYLPLSAEGTLHIASIDVELPRCPGTYRIDALNADEPDEVLGAEIRTFGWPPGIPTVTWRAFTGEITDGVYDFVVVPEPSTLWPLAVGGLIVLKVRRRMRRVGSWIAPCLLIVLVASASTTLAEPVVIPADTISLPVDSGVVSAIGLAPEPSLVFAEAVSVEGAAWVRLHFSAVQLSGSAGQGSESFLRVTSLEDGAVQTLDSFALTTWSNTTACFNGATVLVELFAYPGTGENRVVIDKVLRGNWQGGAPEGGQRSSSMDCEVDDRTLSNDPRTGRVVFWNALFQYASGCTVFLFDERPNCFLTAGHCCVDFDFEYEEYPPLVEFNVPLSNPDESINHPGPEDQYPVDESSVQFEVYYDRMGDDWCYFGAFDNTDTGLSPARAQGVTYRLGCDAPPADQSILRIVGYGRDLTELEHSMVQQADTGLYTYRAGTVLGYGVHTTNGVSGSPVENVCRGSLYGIHTHGGCDDYGMNHGTAIDHPNLQAALANPLGVCAQPLDCNGNGIDDTCDLDCGPPGGACDVPGCGQSADCTGDGVPDECEADCNANGSADSCDVDAGTSADVNDNLIPDECEPDCNENGVPDVCDIDAGTSFDVNFSLVPDECERMLYVDQTAVGANDGSSWQDAYTDLQSALEYVDPFGLVISEVWVAEGVYSPASCDPPCDESSPERDVSFEVPAGVTIYGGFAAGGGDGSFAARDIATYVTILSGDLNGDDGPNFVNNEENGRHVVRMDQPGSAALDGLTVTAGNADGEAGLDAVGAGVVLVYGPSNVVNCVVRGNSASNGGAGALTSYGNHTLTNCLFSGNVAGNWGAGLFNSQGSPTLVNCTFSGNSTPANGLGAGIHNSGGFNGGVTLDNCILWGNSVDGEMDESAQFYNPSGSWDINYTCIQGLTGGLGGTGNIGDDPLLVDANGEDDIFGTEDDNVRLSGGSPCIDAGDNAALPPSVVADLDANRRRSDDPGIEDTGHPEDDAPYVDMGAYEFFVDCNTNEIPDDCDLSCDEPCERWLGCGESVDCNHNGIPDECEVPNCPANLLFSASPADGIVDARVPHPITSTTPCYGFGMPDDPGDAGDESLLYPIVIDIGVTGADVNCWELCETPDMSGSPCGSNSIASVTDNDDGTYTIALTHGVAAGAVTTIQYADDNYVSYIHHPANVDANYAGSTVANAGDITEVVDCLNLGPCENYEADIDASGTQGAVDITVLIDLLIGSQVYDPWMSTNLPVNTGDCPVYCEGGGGLDGGGKGAPSAPDVEGDEPPFGPWYAEFLMAANPPDAPAMLEFLITVEAVTGWCEDHLTSAEKAELIALLTDPEAQFANRAVKALVPRIVAALE